MFAFFAVVAVVVFVCFVCHTRQKGHDKKLDKATPKETNELTNTHTHTLTHTHVYKFLMLSLPKKYSGSDKKTTTTSENWIFKLLLCAKKNKIFNGILLEKSFGLFLNYDINER